MKEAENKQQAIVSSDLVSRQEVIKELHDMYRHCVTLEDWHINGADAIYRIEHMPSAQPEPLSDAYMKAVWTWLLKYQIKAAEFKGSYTPYEVLSWVVNDWRKEHLCRKENR